MTNPNYTLRAVDWKALITQIGKLADAAGEIKKIWDSAKDNCVDADIGASYPMEPDFDDIAAWAEEWREFSRRHLPADLSRTALHRIDSCDDADDRRSAVADYGEMEELVRWASKLK